MKIVIFIIEMVIGVLPASLLSPVALIGSMISIVGTAQNWTNIFHPFGIIRRKGVKSAVD
jgi:hypothetical protein